jgi:hypothetical protein
VVPLPTLSIGYKASLALSYSAFLPWLSGSG